MDPNEFRDSPAGRLVKAKGNYWAFVPNPLPPAMTWSSELVSALSEADRTIGELAGLGRWMSNPHLLIRPFIRREAVFSSRIEGTLASLSDLFTYEAVQLSLFDLPDDVREVHNHVRALEYGLERMQNFPLSLRLIREIHAVLMEGVRGKAQTPGEFRRSQNWTGAPGATLSEASFVPPPVSEMWEALDAFEKFLHAPSSLPPLIRIGLIHHQFEAIHPFLDGNGRVGRLLITLLLCTWDLLPSPLLYLSPYFEAHRAQYYARLRAVSSQGAWEAWLLFFLKGVAVQAKDAVMRINKLQALRERYHALVRGTRASARLLQVLDLLFEKPVLQTRQVQKALNLPNFTTAQRYLDRLHQVGIVRETTGKARNRVYKAEEILAALEQPTLEESSEPKEEKQGDITP